MTSAWALGVVIAAIGCRATTGAGDQSSALAGDWTYQASQDAPQVATIDGSISLHTITGGEGAVEGTFSADEHSGAGGLRRLTGTAAGAMIGDSVADFDVVLDGVSRRHIGVLRADSISGSWVTPGTAVPSNGRFVLNHHRLP